MVADVEESEQNVHAEFFQELSSASAALHDFKPDLVVVFGPDHFNGFFYELMPAFCIGTAAEGSKDWHLESGPLRVPRELALSCVRYLQARDFDVAISHQMGSIMGSRSPHKLTAPRATTCRPCRELRRRSAAVVLAHALGRRSASSWPIRTCASPSSFRRIVARSADAPLDEPARRGAAVDRWHTDADELDAREPCHQGSATWWSARDPACRRASNGIATFCRSFSARGSRTSTR
jgi:hypothetical protein